MSDVTPEFIAEARRTAEYEAERFPNDDWPPIVLALLGALNAAETELRQRELHHFETEQMLAAAEGRVAAARRAGFQDGCRSTEPSEWVREQIAAAERAALGRAAQAIEHGPHRLGHDVSVVCSCIRCEQTMACASIVRDLMPRKDGE